MTRAVIIGAAGRMGRALIKAASGVPGIAITGAIVREGAPQVGQDAGTAAGLPPVRVPLTTDLAASLAACDVVIDFSSPEGAAANLAACRAAGRPLLLGTTGLAADFPERLAEAACDIAVLPAPNTSLAVTLLIELTRIAARNLPVGFDIEIIETHHRAKRDAPSGTAVALGKAAAEGRGIPAPDGRMPAGRTGPRPEGQIGFAVVRAGDIAGEHTVLMAGEGEQVLLSHRACDRAIFARGALAAALWLARQPKGLHSMRDLLQLNQ
jgi:4-hydroxy-tetrahydrodipicolinate reductase